MGAKELSQTDTCRRLSCSVAQLARFRTAGVLSIRVGERKGMRRVWYDAREVDELAKRWKPRARSRARTKAELIMTNARGPVCAKIFAMLEAKRPFAEIVIEAEADPLLVRHLEEEYQLGDFEEARKKQAMAARAEAESMKQRAHELREEREDLRRWKLQMADRGAKKAAASAIEMLLIAQKRDADAAAELLEKKRTG